MKVNQIVNTMETYNSLKTKIDADRQELREYKLFDSHFGINQDRIDKLTEKLRQNQKNLRVLLNTDINDVPKLDLMV